MKKNRILTFLVVIFPIITLTTNLSASIKYGEVKYSYNLDKSNQGDFYFKYSLPHFYNIDLNLQRLIYKDLGLIKDAKDSIKLEDLNDFLEDNFEEFEKNYKEASRDYEVLGFNLENTYNVTEIANYLNVSSISISYFGGAHPNTLINHNVYNTKTNKKVNIQDIINNFDEFKEIAESEFRNLYKVASGYPLSSMGFMFENDKFSLPKQFYLEKDGIVLFWNTYEIAPYVFGPISLKIKYIKINDILKEKEFKN